MRFVGNFLWIISGGIIGWLSWMFFWIILFWTPYSKALLNLAQLQLRPFGREVIKAKDYEAAKKILSTIIPFTFPIDFELNYQMELHDMNVYWWEPPLVAQGSQCGVFGSAIQGVQE